MTDNKLKVGSLVRFLSSVGGGRVARISGDTAWVADEDGFEIPTLIRECVVVEERDSFVPAYQPPVRAQVRETIEAGKANAQPRLQTEPRGETQAEPSLPYTYLPGNERLNASLAFVPMDDRQLGNTSYELYLINDSNYCLYYTYGSIDEAGRVHLRQRGEVEPNTKLFVEEVAPSELNQLERISVQLLAFDKRGYRPVEPMVLEHRIDGRKFFKLHSFVENDFFDEGALLYPLAIDSQPYSTQRIKGEAIAEAMQSPTRPKVQAARRSSDKESKVKPNEPLVIDLHIEQLLDSTTGMSNAEILRYQVEKFHEVMQAHLKRRGFRIIFIHGKGEGVLRSALERELKHKYKGCRYQDASFREYSYGATQITIG